MRFEPAISHIHGIPHVHLLEPEKKESIPLKTHSKDYGGSSNEPIGSQDIKIAKACFERLAAFVEKARCDHFKLPFSHVGDGGGGGGVLEEGRGGRGRRGGGGGGGRVDGNTAKSLGKRRKESPEGSPGPELGAIRRSSRTQA